MIKRILITCTNLISTIDDFRDDLESKNILFDIPDVKQHLSEEELLGIISDYDGWIAGDDPATRSVLEKGRSGRLRALVKWGVGTDSVDIDACKDLDILFSNTPGMFGDEVADSAISYLLCMCRYTHKINQRVKNGDWYKPLGVSLREKKALVIGYGNIGKAVVTRLNAFGVICLIKDPDYKGDKYMKVTDFKLLPECDFVILCCPLVPSTYHLVNDHFLKYVKKTIIIVNVARGPVVDTDSIVKALDTKTIKGYATDVFEKEPLPENSRLRDFNNVMLGSHNSSNTKEAVFRTNKKAIKLISSFLE